MEIQRDRDHGVGDLNTVLQDHDMQPITSWDQFGPRGQVTVINNNNNNNNNNNKNNSVIIIIIIVVLFLLSDKNINYFRK